MSLSERARLVFYSCYFMAGMGFFAVLFVPQDSNLQAVGSTKSFLISWLLLYVFSFLTVLKWQPKFSKVYFIVFFAPLFFVFSSLWSEQPLKSFVYSSSMLLNGVFIISLLAYYSIDGLIKFLVNVLFVMVVLSLVLKILGADFVNYIDIHSRLTVIGTEPIRGLFNHKITAGLYSAIGLVISLCIFSGLKRVLYITTFSVFNLLTGSATGIAMCAIGLVAICFIRFARYFKVQSNVFVFILIVLTILAIFVSYNYLTTILELLNRDPTLTGRTLLWSWAVNVISEQPVLGWGYLGYNGSYLAGNVAETYVQFENYNVPHFHNSYLQVLVEGGLVVFIPLITCLFIAIKLFYSELSGTSSDKYYLAALAVLLVIMVAGIFVNLMYKYNDSISMILMLFISYSYKVYSSRKSDGYKKRYSSK